MNPKYPIYIVSKGRYNTRLTMKALDRMNVKYRVIVEESEYGLYNQYINSENLLILPKTYLENYDTCDDLGDSKGRGPGAARNFAWDHSISEGFEYHWVLDDNIDDFHRLHNNMRVPVRCGSTFRAAEDFTERYENLYISGFNYYSFCKAKDSVPPLTCNTRIYSCLLIKNDIPYRWRGRYNEDTDLCLRVLKDGYCTVQFNAFLQGKVTTQRMSGGNTKEFYSSEGTYNKSKMLVDLHPDVAKIVWKFNRVHHHVDYKPFKKNKLILKEGIVLPTGVNNYGMKLIEVEKGIK